MERYASRGVRYLPGVELRRRKLHPDYSRLSGDWPGEPRAGHEA